MTLRSSIEADATAVFMDADEFSEPVTYNGAGPPNVVVQALVDFRDDERLEGAPNFMGSQQYVVMPLAGLGTREPRAGHKLEVRGYSCEVLTVDDDGFGMIRLRVQVGNLAP